MFTRLLRLVSSLTLLALIFACSKDKSTPTSPASTPTTPVNTENLVPPKGALVVAIHTKDKPFIDWLLKNNVDVNENVGTEEDQITPLMVAVIDKDEELAHRLLMLGANVFAFYKQFSLREYAEYLFGLKSTVTSLIIQKTGGLVISEIFKQDHSPAAATN